MIAASFTRLARSAPVKPVVRPAIASRSTSRPSCTLRDMDLEDLDAALAVGPVDQHLAIEPAGAQQRRIEDFRPVGGGQQDDAGARIEAVELGQQLVERLLLLVDARRTRRRRGCGRARRARR